MAFLEVLVSISLSVIFLSLLSRIYFSTLHFKLSAEATVEARSIESVFNGYLARIIRDYDSHPLLLPPIIHPNGRVRYSDGTYNQVVFGPERLQPDPLSSAITIIAPDFELAMKVDSDTEIESSSLVGCNQDRRALDIELVRSVIAIGIDGIWEARVIAISRIGAEGCYRFHLTSEQGMFLPGLPAQALPFIRRIVPIGELYTIYLARDGELRYLGHAGRINIENQPIISGLSTFKAEHINGTPGGLLGLALSGETRERSIYQARISHFRKIGYEELLLNWLP